MLDVIWLIMIVSSLVFALFQGSVSQVSEAVFSGTKAAVSLSLTLAGTMAFWLGITEIAQCSGLTRKIQRLMLPLINFLFPEFKEEEELREKIALNFTANLLGLGNAATPLGLAAMDEMEKRQGKRDIPSRAMIMFVVINTASLQLLPTQMAGLRSAYGSTEPFAILPQVWLCSLAVMATVIILCKCFGGRAHELRR